MPRLAVYLLIAAAFLVFTILVLATQAREVHHHPSEAPAPRA